MKDNPHIGNMFVSRNNQDKIRVVLDNFIVGAGWWGECCYLAGLHAADVFMGDAGVGSDTADFMCDGNTQACTLLRRSMNKCGNDPCVKDIKETGENLYRIIKPAFELHSGFAITIIPGQPDCNIIKRLCRTPRGQRIWLDRGMCHLIASHPSHVFTTHHGNRSRIKVKAAIRIANRRVTLFDLFGSNPPILFLRNP